MIAMQAVTRRLLAPQLRDPLRQHTILLATICAVCGASGGLVVAGHRVLALTTVGALLIGLASSARGLLRLRSHILASRQHERRVFRAWDRSARGEWFYWQQRLLVDAVLLAATLILCLLLWSGGIGSTIAAAVAMASTAGLTAGELLLWCIALPGHSGVDG